MHDGNEHKEGNIGSSNAQDARYGTEAGILDRRSEWALHQAKSWRVLLRIPILKDEACARRTTGSALRSTSDESCRHDPE